jgi:hypothetical protein
VFQREEIDLVPISGSPAGNTTLTFQLEKSGVYITRMWLRPTFTKLAPSSSSYYVARADNIGYAHVKEIRIKSGSQRCQTIHKEDLLNHHKHWLPVQEQLAYDHAAGCNIPLAQRKKDALVDKTYKVPVHTAFFQCTDSNALACQSLTQKIAIEIDIESYLNWLQTNDASWTVGGSSSRTVEANYFTSGFAGVGYALTVEYGHTTDVERVQMTNLYKSVTGVRYLFPEVQMMQPLTIASAWDITNATSVSQVIQGIDQPVYCFFIVFRWAKDLNRLAGDTTGYTHGRDHFNVSGWRLPSGYASTSTPLISSVEIKSNQDYIMRAQPVEDSLFEHKGRFFTGGLGFNVLARSLSHAPCARNATLGAIDFGEISSAKITVNLAGSPNSVTTIGAYGNLDIGQTGSDLQVDLWAWTYQNIDIANTDIDKPFG